MGSDLSLVLEKQAKRLFELDDLSWKILEQIALNGNTTEYNLNKLLPRVSRTPIRNRLLGTKKYIGLERHGFIRIFNLETIAPNLGKLKQSYNILFKGFIASLGVVPLKKNQLFLHLKGRLLSKHPEILLNYVKSEIALWFQTYIENDLKLSKMKNFSFNYLQTRRMFDSEDIFTEPDLQIEGFEESGQIYVRIAEHNRKVFSDEWHSLKVEWKTARDEATAIFSGLSRELAEEIVDEWPRWLWDYEKPSPNLIT